MNPLSHCIDNIGQVAPWVDAWFVACSLNWLAKRHLPWAWILNYKLFSSLMRIVPWELAYNSITVSYDQFQYHFK